MIGLFYVTVKEGSKEKFQNIKFGKKYLACNAGPSELDLIDDEGSFMTKDKHHFMFAGFPEASEPIDNTTIIEQIAKLEAEVIKVKEANKKLSEYVAKLPIPKSK